MLLPLFHCMKADETVLRLASRPSRPRALVLSPTRELAQQTLGVAKSLSHHCRARVVGITGGAKRGRQVAALADAQGVDVVVGTPGRLLQLQQAGSLSLADVRYIAIDEADSMLLDDVLDAPASQREDGEGSERESFSGETGRLLLPVLRALRAGDAFTGSGAPRSPPPGPFDPTLPVERCVQFLLAAATVAPSAEAALQRRIPGGVSIIRARGTHACPSQLEARFVRVGSGPEAEFGDKMDALHAELARAASNAGRSRAAGRGGGSAGGGHRTIVFCGTIQSARAVAKEAQGRGWLVASLHGGIPPQLRAAEFQAAVTGERPVLVATDAAARGLDLSGADDVIIAESMRRRYSSAPFADAVASAAIEAYDALRPPELVTKQTVLAAIVARFDSVGERGRPALAVLSLGVGTRFLRGKRSSLPASALVDMHAEVLARRGLVRLLMASVRDGGGCRSGAAAGYPALLVTSSVPAAGSPAPGPFTCSDKIALWQCVGLQGAILAPRLGAVRLSGVIAGRKCSVQTLHRACGGRMAAWRFGGGTGGGGDEEAASGREAAAQAAIRPGLRVAEACMLASGVQFDKGALQGRTGAEFEGSPCGWWSADMAAAEASPRAVAGSSAEAAAASDGDVMPVAGGAPMECLDGTTGLTLGAGLAPGISREGLTSLAAAAGLMARGSSWQAAKEAATEYCQAKASVMAFVEAALSVEGAARHRKKRRRPAEAEIKTSD
ncbi:hypothetical protein FNF27_02494 [Cafeteria roenbergensis]|uniref:Helicase C-terminal domain-containing protein n=1 Tax=Cafeteria roenbergensis TaxID=33653 RepID=A0A5A8EFS4_CAFRO|nr:hypothetical protein FNF27_02494 [Cafeteria roenbergensis]